MNTEFTGFVTAGGDHATAVGLAADNQRFALEFGKIALFNRRIKGVHINMDDFALSGHFSAANQGYFALSTSGRVTTMIVSVCRPACRVDCRMRQWYFNGLNLI